MRQSPPSDLAGLLAAVDLGYPFTIHAGVPDGPDWITLDRLATDPALLDAWLSDLLAGEARGQLPVAAVSLAAYVASAVADPLTVALATLGRAWPVTPTGTAVHRHPDGWCDGVAIAHPQRPPADDPLHPAAPDPAADPFRTAAHDPADEAYRTAARDVVAALGPVFEAIRARTRIGRPAMWGGLGDMIAAAAVDQARYRGTDPGVAWHGAQRLVDAIAEHAPQVRARRSLVVIAHPGPAGFVARGTCCLDYRVGGDYCTRCPLRTPEDRLARWTTELAAERGDPESWTPGAAVATPGVHDSGSPPTHPDRCAESPGSRACLWAETPDCPAA
ncbi:(2Fe-2S)-binding protein [Catellatospora sp. KI3]|uniref:(2Fe-2S)-binding protein n=1 Tax=Catellatospora sp. KI3 TaxID=3041620 RepID=UPI0024825FF7|nr:(2Fe-2S)-binding protein [Catellatospora sp. KI3]MDI1461640.1 (2Fe-2S)-binding protein [Catellatospora sp. KI3]